MKKNGFTLIELLACLALLGIVLALGVRATKGTLATSLSQLRVINDNEIFNSARSYVLEENASFINGYVCVTVKELIDYGYLDDTNDEEVKRKIVKITRDNQTKVIQSVKYVDVCN